MANEEKVLMDTKDLGRDVFHNKLDMKIQNLISPDNIGNPENVKSFQSLMNRHIYGEDKLAVDGQWGKQTNQSLLDYRWSRKHWFGGNENWDVDARRTAKLYDVRREIKKEERSYRHTNPKGLRY